jgi:hypothetical protein
MIKRYEDCTPEEQAEFDKVFDEANEKERKWFESWGYLPGETMAARLAYQAFIEKETRENPNNFYKTPLARKAFMIGWLRNKL